MNWLKCLLASCIVLACHIVGVSNANASSDFDNFPTTDDWTIQRSNCPLVDLRYTWGSIIADQAPGAYAQIVANGTNGGWYVWRQVHDGATRAIVVMIVKAETGPSSYTIAHHSGGGGWLGNSGNQWLYTTTEGTRVEDTYDLRIVLDSSCQPFVENYGYAGAGHAEYSPYQTPEYMGMPDMTGRPFIFRNYMLLAVGDFIAPVGYEGPVIPDVVSDPAYAYVAMGDSFSSGEGNPPFEFGTDIDNMNECHRSPDAYPRILDGRLSLGKMAFVACSGATTQTVLGGAVDDGSWSEGSQIDALSAETEIVTLTIGGNDVGFPEYAEDCVGTLCGPLTDPYTFIMSRINDPSFHDDLVDVYSAILDVASNAEVYVAGYPYLAPESASCTFADMSGAYYVQLALNSVIEDAVEEAADADNPLVHRIHYVDTNATGSPFDEHFVCGGSEASDFNNVDVANQEYSFHPNVSGQTHYADVFEDAM